MSFIVIPLSAKSNELGAFSLSVTNAFLYFNPNFWVGGSNSLQNEPKAGSLEALLGVKFLSFLLDLNLVVLTFEPLLSDFLFEEILLTLVLLLALWIGRLLFLLERSFLLLLREACRRSWAEISTWSLEANFLHFLLLLNAISGRFLTDFEKFEILVNSNLSWNFKWPLFWTRTFWPRLWDLVGTDFNTGVSSPISSGISHSSKSLWDSAGTTDSIKLVFNSSLGGVNLKF